MGLWLVQECRRQWKKDGHEHTYAELARLAAEPKPLTAIKNTNPKAPPHGTPHTRNSVNLSDLFNRKLQIANCKSPPPPFFLPPARVSLTVSPPLPLVRAARLFQRKSLRWVRPTLLWSNFF